MSDMLMKVGKQSDRAGIGTDDVLVKAFHQRLVDVMDQAQHFGGSANTLGATSRYGDTGGGFREGLEATERECKPTSQVCPESMSV